MLARGNNSRVLNPDYASEIKAADPVATLARDIFKQKSGSHSEGIPVPFFDPLAAMILAGGMTDYQSHHQYLDVELLETEKDNRCGCTCVTDSAAPALCAWST